MNRKRYQQIAGVLARHGIGFLAASMHGTHPEPVAEHVPGAGNRHRAVTPPEHVRRALQELGTTFVKLGQILSTRSDLLSPEYRAELARLQDDDIPVPAGVIRGIIEEALGQRVDEAFSRFDDVPIAAASIGQVHGAALPDGREVVVKVRRPHVVELVHEDLAILRNLAESARRHWGPAERYDVVGLVEEFSQVLLGELDYIQEARNIERYAANFAGDATIHIPWVDWSRTAPTVLTMERIYGAKPLDIAGIEAAGLNRADLARRSAEIVLTSVFEHGFYHADPHPGNFFYQPDGCIGLIDFGMMGTVDEMTRHQLIELLLAISSRDADQLVDALLDLGMARRNVDRRRLADELGRVVGRYYELPLTEWSAGPLIESVYGVMRRHGMALPSRLALLVKTAVMAEGVGAQVDPGFRLPALLVPFTERLVRAQYGPAQLARQMQRTALETARLGTDLPRRVRRLLSDAERGGLQVGVRLDEVQSLVSRFEQLTNRLVLGILAGAFIVGLAVLMSAYRPSGWERWAGWMFGGGFVVVSVLGIYLAWGIVRPTKRQ
ncbi:MAG TPA: AarF/UbiB family protein [Gemmatimonadaceae bacterium]|nr:AarF/UbiB family protein [Gemmatimonadaceae bacterium]